MFFYLGPERDDGNIEYKLTLNNISEYKLIKYATQMKWRLAEGNGICKYTIGLLDNGTIIGVNDTDLENTIHTLLLITKNIDVHILKYRIKRISGKNIILAYIKSDSNNIYKNRPVVKISVLYFKNQTPQNRECPFGIKVYEWVVYLA